MKKTLLLLTLVLVIALVAAIPAFADPAEDSGPIVARYQGIFIAHYNDPANGLGAIIGADIREFCSGVVDFDLVNIQDIDVPEDANRIVQIFDDDAITISVWPFPEFDCGLFLSTDPVAAGTAAIVGTDNDLTVFNNPDNVNWNAYGFTAHGSLTAADGSSVRLNTVSRCVWDGVDGDSGHCVGRINLID